MTIAGILRRKFGRAKSASFLRNTRGATAVEFAMVAPIFLLMLGVILETGLMLFTEYVLQTSVQDAARWVRTGRAQEAKLSATQFKAKVCETAGLMINCNSKVTVYLASAANFTALNTLVPSYLSIGAKSDGTTDPQPFSCGGPSEAVALIATYDWEFTIPYFMDFFGNISGNKKRRMAGFAMFKNEPFPSVAGNKCT